MALANILTGLGIDERFTSTEDATASTYLTDALGSSVALADGTGTVKTSYGYDLYDNTGATGSANDNTYQYAGRQNDGTGLYYNRARYYNPAWGRFIAEDPIGLDGGINVYAYALGNPINFDDPSGLDVQVCYFPDAAYGLGHVGIGTPGGPTYGFYPTHQTTPGSVGGIYGPANDSGYSPVPGDLYKNIPQSEK